MKEARAPAEVEDLLGSTQDIKMVIAQLDPTCSGLKVVEIL